MVAVFNGKNKDRDICAGIIVNEWIVLTAGYCVFECKDEPYLVSILGGVVDMRDHERDQWRYGKELIFYEEEYEGIPYLVAIKISSPFYIQFLIQAMPLPKSAFSRKSICYTSGWSLEDRMETFLEHFPEFHTFDLKSLVLKYNEADPVEKVLCNEFYKDIFIHPINGTICLTDVIRNRDFAECIGGDGTILSCYDNPTDLLIPVGIATSVRSSNCLDPGPRRWPATFFDLGFFSSWIEQKVLKN